MFRRARQHLFFFLQALLLTIYSGIFLARMAHAVPEESVLPRCGVVASLVPRCACGGEVFDKAQWANQQVFCCKETTRTFLSKELCPSRLDRQRRLKEIFCPVEKLWNEDTRILQAFQFTPDTRLLIHPAIKERFQQVKRELRNVDYHVDPSTTVAFNPRKVSHYEGDIDLYSLHAYGIAIDLNWNTNLYCPLFPDRSGCSGRPSALVTDLPREVIEIFSKAGFEWGGDWPVPDPTHFELREENWPLKRRCSDWEKFRVTRENCKSCNRGEEKERNG